MLGVSLIFVGITLVLNGVNRLCKVDPKSTAFMNAITGIVIVLGNFILMGRAQSNGDYLNIASGLLFGFTYVFIAANYLLKLDLRPFGWFSVFVAIYATVMSVIAFCTGGWFFGALWAMWAVLWLEGFVEIVLKAKLARIFPYLCIFEGLFAAFIPAVLLLLEVAPI